jgi:N-acetylneuraminate synthase
MHKFSLGERLVGPGNPVLIIAEAGVNHNGDVRLAYGLIDAAAAAGADIVKFQSFVTDETVTRSARKADYQIAATDPAESQFRMLKALELSREEQADLNAHCSRRGVLFLSTPYDRPSVDVLCGIGVLGIKIGSTDTTNLPFLEYVARKGKPIILSTGMCDLKEVSAAVETLRVSGAQQLALLHCTSQYPALLDEVNLRAIETLADCFACPVGFSDHTRGIEASVWAVAAGASIIEKHFTLDCNLPGPDHRASLEPAQMAKLVQLIRQVERSLGTGRKAPSPCELPNKPVMRRSLVARRPIAAGEVIKPDALACKRPGHGLQPGLWKRVVGKRSARAIAADEILTMDCIVWE